MRRLQLYIKAVLLLGLLAGCNRPEPPPGVTVSAPTVPIPSASAAETVAASSPLPPTPTLLPLAVRVDGFTVTAAEFEAELAQFQAANDGAELTPEDRKRVLEALIDEALLAAGALNAGFELDDSELAARRANLAAQVGGEAGLSSWIEKNYYTPESFDLALRRSAAAAWMRDQILAQTPRLAEQIHARQILLYNSNEAAEVYSLLQAGNDFGNLAVQYDPITRGELGWFPRGYLTDSKLDEAVFALQPGGYTPVIQTAAGFHILEVLEREVDRPLSPEALLKVQAAAIQNWLTERRGTSQIEILLPE